MPWLDTNPNDVIASEAAAQSSFLRRRWRLIHAFDRVVQLLLPILPRPRTIEGSAAQPARILVIEYWNLGDVAIVVPFLRNLRRSFPKAQISLLVNARFKTFLEGQGIVDEFIPVRVPWAEHFSHWKKYNPFSLRWLSLIRSLLYLRERQFDWAFSGRMDIRDNLILWFSGASRRIGYGLGGGGCLLTDRVPPDLSRPHRADIWLHLLRAIGESPDRELGGYRLTGTERASARTFLGKLGIPSDAFLVGVHPGARIVTRRWGDDRFSEVVRRILSESDAFHVLWFSEPGASWPVLPSERCHPMSHDLRSFLGVLSHCQLLLCNDSGPMHLANLLDVPVVAIFGPQRPEWFGPRGRQDQVVFRPEIWCRPCIDHCIFDQPYCLRVISTDEVYGAVRRVLQLAESQAPERIGVSSLMDRPLIPDLISAPRPAARQFAITRETKGA
jgi:ADP-heptose:LPS heptosyltransferase